MHLLIHVWTSACDAHQVFLNRNDVIIAISQAAAHLLVLLFLIRQVHQYFLSFLDHVLLLVVFDRRSKHISVSSVQEYDLLASPILNLALMRNAGVR